MESTAGSREFSSLSNIPESNKESKCNRLGDSPETRRLIEQSGSITDAVDSAPGLHLRVAARQPEVKSCWFTSIVALPPSTESVDLLKAALADGANPNARDQRDHTALHHVVHWLKTAGRWCYTLQMIQLLCEYGVDVNAYSARLEGTPLDVVGLVRPNALSAMERQLLDSLRKLGLKTQAELQAESA